MRRPAVDWLAGLLSGPDGRTVVGWGDERPAGDWRPAETYTVVPDGRGAVMLLPRDRRAAGRVLGGYAGLRPPLRRLGRRALAAALRTGLPAHRLTIWTPPGAGAVTLVGRLAELLELPDPVAAITSGVAGPNRKPMLQLCDHDGRPRAFVKLGWNDATRDQVLAEAAALRRLARRPADGLRVPELLGDGRVGELELVATAPLPRDVRRYRHADGPPAPAVTRAIAATGDVGEEPLSASDYWRRLRDRLTRARPEARRPGDAWEHLARGVATVEGRYGDQSVPLGAWHGDWSPWNLGWSAGTLHVWDWEHAHVQAPLGADVLHWHFQTAFVLDQRPFDAALAHATRAAAADLSTLDATPTDVLRATYVLELALRHQAAVQAGAATNPRLPEAWDAVLDTGSARSPAARSPAARTAPASHTTSPANWRSS